MEVTYKQHCGDDLMVVNAARVSFSKEHDKFEEPKDGKLIRYLARHKHHSPFNHTFITCHVKAPIFVARQLVKHEYMPWNEVSRRYVDDNVELYDMGKWRMKAENVKQGSGDELETLPLDTEVSVEEAQAASIRAYNDLLKTGVAPEMARAVLPLNLYTEWFWSGTLKAWAKMYALRIDGHAQKECQDIARQVGDIIEPLFPVSWGPLTESLK